MYQFAPLRGLIVGKRSKTIASLRNTSFRFRRENGKLTDSTFLFTVAVCALDAAALPPTLLCIWERPSKARCSRTHMAFLLLVWRSNKDSFFSSFFWRGCALLCVYARQCLCSVNCNGACAATLISQKLTLMLLDQVLFSAPSKKRYFYSVSSFLCRCTLFTCLFVSAFFFFLLLFVVFGLFFCCCFPSMYVSMIPWKICGAAKVKGTAALCTHGAENN